MREWIQLFERSRTAHIALLCGMGMFGVACCGGMALADYTVGGMNSYYFTGGHAPAMAHAGTNDPWWIDAGVPAQTASQGYTRAGFDAAETASW